MTADELRQLLQLTPLEMEGGFFRETYRSRWQVSAEHLPAGITGTRSISTAIYYMITPESFSTLHRLPGTEIFHFYLGDPVVMLQLHPEGKTQSVTLGHDLAAGQLPQVVVRGGVWRDADWLMEVSGRFWVLPCPPASTMPTMKAACAMN